MLKYQIKCPLCRKRAFEISAISDSGEVKQLQIETIHARYIEELDHLVDEFTTDKIIYDIKIQRLYSGWEAHIFYDDIPEKTEKINGAEIVERQNIQIK